MAKLAAGKQMFDLAETGQNNAYGCGQSGLIECRPLGAVTLGLALERAAGRLASITWIKRPLARFMTLLGMLALTACSYQSLPTYRYRMTVEVETPEGLRTGSTVIEVRSNIQRTPVSKGGVIRAIGEAATIDLGKRGRLYALLRSEAVSDWGAQLYGFLTPHYPGQTAMEAAEARAANRGPIVLPRYLKPQSAATKDPPFSGYPCWCILRTASIQRASDASIQTIWTQRWARASNFGALSSKSPRTNLVSRLSGIFPG